MLQGLLLKALQEHIYKLLRGRELNLKVKSIDKNITCEDTECIFPLVILGIIFFGGYHVPDTGLFLLPIFLKRYLCGEVALCRCLLYCS